MRSVLTKLLATSFLLPTVAQAALINTPQFYNSSSKFRDLGTAIGSIFDIVIIVAGIVFVVLLLIGGVQYLTAAGNEENTKKALKLMLDGLVGLVIVLLAYPVGRFIIKDQLQINDINF